MQMNEWIPFLLFRLENKRFDILYNLQLSNFLKFLNVDFKNRIWTGMKWAKN